MVVPKRSAAKKVTRISLPEDIEGKQVAVSNRLIEARYRLSVFQIRLIWLFASQIKKGEEDFRFYQVPIRDIVRLVGKGTKRAHEKIEEAVTGLIGSVVEIPTKSLEASFKPAHGAGKRTRNRDWAKAAWVASAEYKSAEGIIEFEFSEKLKPYLLSLTREFTVLEFQNLLSLSSKYSIRIYMLLRQYRSIGERTISLDKLRYALALEPGQYERFNDFSRFVLDLAQREVSQKTDISFTWQGLKNGRRFNRIKFAITTKHDGLFTALPEVDPAPVKEMIAFGVSRGEAGAMWRSQWDYLTSDALAELELTINEGLDFVQYVRDKIQLLKLAQEKGSIPNPGGWLKRAIERNYTTTERAGRRRQRATKRKAKQASDAELQKEAEAQRQRDARYEELDSQLAALPEKEKQRIAEQIEERIRANFDDFLRGVYRTKPFDPKSPIHRNEYYQHLAARLQVQEEMK